MQHDTMLNNSEVKRRLQLQRQLDSLDPLAGPHAWLLKEVMRREADPTLRLIKLICSQAFDGPSCITRTYRRNSPLPPSAADAFYSDGEFLSGSQPRSRRSR